MESINPINVNAQGINGSAGFGKKAKPEQKEETEKEVTVAAQKNPVAADKVLSFMAQSAVAVAPATTKALDPSKYVDEASAARIAGFMAQFEDKVAEGLKAFDAEFPGVEVSESTKMAVVLGKIDRE